ncbi:MAG TPA: fibronectin type III domain-containing protein, partial [Solirubrobacteraceae bacterium]|nr:fibronectin type III domain-containing protein [Solirubrobacteraceae bacterium]
MHGCGRWLVPRALVVLAVLGVLGSVSAALADSGPKPPEVTTEQSLPVTKTTAVLNGMVNPRGVAVTSCEFKYGTSPGSLSSSAPCAPRPGAGSAPEAVSAEVTGLSPNTTYYVQVVASGEEGTAEGSTVSFKTIANAPVASTGEAGEVKLTSAVLAGSVNPEGASVTKCEFKYGTTAGSLGSVAACSPPPGSGTAPEAVTAQLTELSPGTTYHFELLAAGEGGETTGKEEEFTTPANGLVVVTGEALSVTRTTAKLTGTVNPGGSQVTECEFEYGTTAGSPEARVPCSALPGAGTEAVA